MGNDTDIGLCPFCCEERGRRDIAWFGNVAQGRAAGYAIFCACGARGPCEDTEARALLAWNDLSTLRFAPPMTEVGHAPPTEFEASVYVRVWTGKCWVIRTEESEQLAAFHLLRGISAQLRLPVVSSFCGECGNHHNCGHEKVAAGKGSE